MSSLVKYSCLYCVHLTVCTSNHPIFLTSLLGKKKTFQIGGKPLCKACKSPYYSFLRYLSLELSSTKYKISSLRETTQLLSSPKASGEQNKAQITSL